MSLSILILQIATYLSFTWAALFYFKIKKKNVGYFAISIFGTASMVGGLYCTFNTVPNFISTLLGALLYLGSLTLFWSTIRTVKFRLSFAFSSTHSDTLVTQGPYKLVRHPIYLSYELAWIAGFIYSHSPYLIFSILLMGTLYVQAAKIEERELLNGPNGSAYKEYLKHTPMLIPYT